MRAALESNDSRETAATFKRWCLRKHEHSPHLSFNPHLMCSSRMHFKRKLIHKLPRNWTELLSSNNLKPPNTPEEFILLSFYPSILLSFYPSILLSFYPSILLSFYPSILLSFYPSILVSLYPCIPLSFYHSILLSFIQRKHL